jgi:ATP-binding cassette subfamily B protein
LRNKWRPNGAPSQPIQIRGEIKLEQVSFAYQSSPPVISDLSLHIPAGETIGIVGATGSGKSTLVKLLMRLYEINAGKISLDGMDIRDLKLRDLRGCMGLVSQDVFLFHGSVWENIAYGSFDATTAAIEAAAEIAEADDLLLNCPRAMTRSWVSGGKSSLVGKDKGWRSPGQSYAIHRF